MSTEARYLNPFTDFGFKKLFGEESNKDILMDFLNALLEGEQAPIVELTFIKTEQLGLQQVDRRAVFDLYCENERGERFIVELQKSKQTYFKDRSLYYATFPIREQANKGDWNYQLTPVYTIAILDFVFDDPSHPDKWLYKVKLSDIDTHSVFYDKLTFIYLEMPKFNKGIDELSSHFERWLYALRNLNRLDRYPPQLQEKIFQKFFEQAELAQLSPEKRLDYEDSLKYYRDLHAVIDTAFIEGKLEGEQLGLEKGLAQGKEEGLAQGMEAGLAQGRLEASITLLSRQLSRRFGELPDWVQSKLHQATVAELDAWTEAIFDATSLKQLFETG